MDQLVDLSFPSDGVAQILQGTGPRNFSRFAANVQLIEALARAREAGARVVVVGSSVEGFFAGHGWLPDVIDTFTGGTPTGDPTAGWRAFNELDSGPMISIAAIDGEAWGHGAELAWACDLRVASTQATFGQPEGAALDQALAWARWLAARPASGLDACKRAIKGARDLPFEAALKRESSVFIESSAGRTP